MIIQEPVQAAIWHCINHYDLQDATFLAERLCAEVETDETIFILATCYYRANMIHQAYWLLQTKSPRSPQCRFLLAKCAYQLKKLSEAEAALLNGSFAELKAFDELCKEFGEVACFALQLIAKICTQTERYSIAIDALKMALKLNPFLWNAFSDLCNLGEKIDPNAIFQFSNIDIFNTCQGNNNTNSMILFGLNCNLNDDLTTTTPTPATIGGTTLTTGLITQQQQTTTTSSSLQTAGADLVNNLSNSNTNNDNYIYSTPVEQVSQHCINITTPNNNNNNNNNNNSLNNTISSILRRANTSNYLTRNGCKLIEETPTSHQQQMNNYSNDYIKNIDGCNTPFRNKFKYLSSISPQTPSFGILPLSSPSDSSPITNFNINCTPSPQTLVEVNQEQKSIGKKLKGHVGSIINRKDISGNGVGGGGVGVVGIGGGGNIGVINNNSVGGGGGGVGGGGGNFQVKPTVFTQTGNITPRTPNSLTGQNVRRSSRLFGNSNYSVKENNKSPNINKFAQPRSPPRKTKQRIAKISSLNNEIINEKEKMGKIKEKIETITSNNNKVLHNNSLNNAQTMAHLLSLKKQSAEGLMTLLRELGQSYQQLAQFNCKEAISILSTIPNHHYRTSWVQSMLALAHFEQRDYEAAAKIFQEIHEKEPNRMHLMEIYSTALWHLQREVTLSALAQDLMAQDKISPVTWCVTGNCFSLQKEHETAIKFFKRAVQVDPDFVYSYTVLGHELVITEELDKAMSCFRTAILKNPRHYNAWFGIGTIYSKQKRYELAELHYRRALKINPKNAVIMVHIGAMQFLMHRVEQALQTLNTAIALDPKNPLCKFHRCSMNYSLGKHQEALRELEELKQIVPKESVVFYLMGKIHKSLGNVDLALMHFSWATDLDPKGANNQLKDAFDTNNHSPSSQQTVSELNNIIDGDIEPISERSDDSTQVQLDINYDRDSSDGY